MPRSKDLNAIDMHVGARVRMRRLMLDMTQEKLGDALGVTFQQVQKYEKGANRIGAGAFAAALDHSPGAGRVLLRRPETGHRGFDHWFSFRRPSHIRARPVPDKLRGSCLDQGLHADQGCRDPPPHCELGGRDRESARPALIIRRRALLPDLSFPARRGRTYQQAKLYFSIPLSFDARAAHVGLWHHKSERRCPISSRR